MALGAVGLFLLGTAAGISAPIVSRGAITGVQHIVAETKAVPIPFAGSRRLVTKTTPEIEKAVAGEKAKTADIIARRGISRAISLEKDVDIFGLKLPNINVPFMGGKLAGVQAAVPGAMAFRSEQYESAVLSGLLKQGFPRKKAERTARIMAERFRAESAGEATGAIILSTLSEAGGASLAQTGFKQAGAVPAKLAAKTAGKTVAKAAGLAGIFEAVSIDIMSQIGGVSAGREKFKPGQTGLPAASGAATAAVLGGGIAYSATKFKRAGKLPLYAAYTIDPFEAPGDILAGRLIEGKAPGFPTPVITIVPTVTQTQTQTQAANGKKKAIKVKSKVPVNIYTPVQISFPVQGVTPVDTPIGIQTQQDVTPYTPVTITSETPTNIQDIITNIFQSTSEETPTTVETPATVPTPTQTPTTIQTPVTIPVITSRKPLIPPLLPPFGGGAGSGAVNRRGRLLYFDEWRAAGRALRRFL